MAIRIPRLKDKTAPPTWDKFKSAIRRVDRDSLLIQAAAVTSSIARGELPDEFRNSGLTEWNVADVARTALASATFQRPKTDGETLHRLCHLNAFLVDEGLSDEADSTEWLGRVLARTLFEQFPSQQSIMDGVARTILLFGSAAEHPRGFVPAVMTPGWFERIAGGLTLDQYVESVFLISVETLVSNGGFSLARLDSPEFQELREVISLDAVRQTFVEHLLTTPSEFKAQNRTFQDPLPAAQKKFAFNPLADTPFIEGVAEIPIAPWVQAVITKALPPAVYHLALRNSGDDFTRDLGIVFQHYVGRQLEVVQGSRQVYPETRYGPRRESIDSCDWFLNLPGLLVLIECKARQPIESLRVGGADWLSSVKSSIGKGIEQLNRSNSDILKISTSNPTIDITKPRVGLVVTLEPFYLNQNWIIRDHLPGAEFPVGVLSVGELESLVRLNANELDDVLRAAALASQGNVMLLSKALAATSGRENPLLVSTWQAIGLFGRATSAANRLRALRTDA